MTQTMTRLPAPRPKADPGISRGPAIVTRFLLLAYYPFLALTLGVIASVTVASGVACYRYPFFTFIFGPLALICALSLARLLWSLRVIFMKIPDREDEMELRVPREMAPGLYEWAEEIAGGRGLPAPEDIRVAADTVAHVYQRVNGSQVLVLGAIAVRALPQQVLAGIVAHELGHVAAGDTGRGRAELRALVVMGVIEGEFRGSNSRRLRLGRRPRLSQALAEFLRGASRINPLALPLRGYHLLCSMARAARSRQQEYAADRHEVRESGAEAAAAALILVTVSQRMPWTRLSSLAESWAATNELPQRLFEEQARAVRALDTSEWQDALRKELKEPSGLFDTHPGLKDRLAAMGVSPKQALRLTPQLSGSPSHELFDKWWPQLEKRLADLLLAPFREAHIAKMQLGELARALWR
jgi:Zn-dependent protease with chaperone function